MRKKVSIIGMGNVGSATVLYLAEKGVADLALVDLMEDVPAGKALDIMESSPMRGHDIKITGGNDFSIVSGSDVVVVTAGLPRKPGMSRTDLLSVNAKTIGEVSRKVADHAPNAILIVVTNPLDVMCYVALESSGFALKKVMGMAGVLDSTRFRYFIAHELGVSMEDTAALVLGGHGDSMLPLTRYTTVSGIPITELLPRESIERLVDRTRTGGAEVVHLLKKGSAFYAPAAAIAEMVESILTDSHRILPVSAYLRGEYGLWDVFCGVPAKIGDNGIEEIIEINLTDEEMASLHRSAGEVRSLVEEWRKMITGDSGGGMLRERYKPA